LHGRNDKIFAFTDDRKKIFSHRKKKLFFLSCNIAAVQNVCLLQSEVFDSPIGGMTKIEIGTMSTCIWKIIDLWEVKFMTEYE